MNPSSLAEYIRQHPEEFRLPYEPVSLPPLPRAKCPHQVITHVRVSDEMSSAKKGARGCIGSALEHGWCWYHAPAHEFLCLGARINYQRVFLGTTGARGVEPGVCQWEIYAQTTKPEHLKEDIVRLKARFNL